MQCCSERHGAKNLPVKISENCGALGRRRWHSVCLTYLLGTLLLQEQDDMRKRARQERLAELRTGMRRSWVHLHRGLPAEQSYITA